METNAYLIFSFSHSLPRLATRSLYMMWTFYWLRGYWYRSPFKANAHNLFIYPEIICFVVVIQRSAMIEFSCVSNRDMISIALLSCNTSERGTKKRRRLKQPTITVDWIWSERTFRFAEQLSFAIRLSGILESSWRNCRFSAVDGSNSDHASTGKKICIVRSDIYIGVENDMEINFEKLIGANNRLQ